MVLVKLVAGRVPEARGRSLFWGNERGDSTCALGMKRFVASLDESCQGGRPLRSCGWASSRRVSSSVCSRRADPSVSASATACRIMCAATFAGGSPALLASLLSFCARDSGSVTLMRRLARRG